MDQTNPKTRSRRGRLIVSVVAISALGAWGVVGFDAARADTASHKVTLCHATDSTTTPYALVTVDYNSITRTGHGEHTGPIYTPGIVGKWGDIIPTFDFGDGTYPGMNFDGPGQTILLNGCIVTTPTTTVTLPPE